jgi:hypothetical protein
MSANAVTLPNSSVYTFTNSNTYGTDAMADLGGGNFGMWAGDANSDGNVIFIGENDDRTVITNTTGLYDLTNIVSNVYNSADLNLDGNVIFIGENDDRTVITNTTGLYDLTNIVATQVP